MSKCMQACKVTYEIFQIQHQHARIHAALRVLCRRWFLQAHPHMDVESITSSLPLLRLHVACWPPPSCEGFFFSFRAPLLSTCRLPFSSVRSLGFSLGLGSRLQALLGSRLGGLLGSGFFGACFWIRFLAFRGSPAAHPLLSCSWKPWGQ